MADVWEKDLAKKSSYTVNDFVRVVGSDNVSYKQPVSEVLYAGGVRYKEFPIGTAFSDFADSCNIGITFSYTRYPSQSSDSPTSTNVRCAITVCKTYSDEITMSVTVFANATENIIYERRRFGTWGSWVQLPTRAEVNALNSKITFANISRQYIVYYTNGRIQTKTYLNDNQTVYAFTISETGLSLAKSTDNEATYTTLWTK